MEEISVEQLAAAPQPMTYSANDSAEGIAPHTDLDDEQIRRMLASPLSREREGESQAYHSERESLMTQSLGIPELQANLMRCVYRSEKQMQSDIKLITRDEKA